MKITVRELRQIINEEVKKSRQKTISLVLDYDIPEGEDSKAFARKIKRIVRQEMGDSLVSIGEEEILVKSSGWKKIRTLQASLASLGDTYDVRVSAERKRKR